MGLPWALDKEILEKGQVEEERLGTVDPFGVRAAAPLATTMA
jgi:hypothetical protein